MALMGHRNFWRAYNTKCYNDLKNSPNVFVVFLCLFFGRISRYIFQGYFSSLRAELFDKGITVTAICPGPVRTASVQNSVTEVSGEMRYINSNGLTYARDGIKCKHKTNHPQELCESSIGTYFIHCTFYFYHCTNWSGVHERT